MLSLAGYCVLTQLDPQAAGIQKAVYGDDLNM